MFRQLHNSIYIIALMLVTGCSTAHDSVSQINDYRYNQVLAKESKYPIPKVEFRGTNKQIIEDVNAYVNDHIKYVSDAETYGVKDYWQSSVETLRRKTGDCEDIALLKRKILHNFNIVSYPLMVYDNRVMDYHMVLIVKDGSDEYVLDSRNDKISNRISKDYSALYSIATPGAMK